MKNKHFIWICAILLALASSCQKDKDITIVYGLINPADSVHYIRIHKAFLGPESIIVMAKEPDSSLYPVEDIDVRITEFNTLSGKSTPLAVDTITKDKEPGYFYHEKGQRMYYFEKKFEKTTSSGVDTYKVDGIVMKIEVENKKTGKIVYAETPLVNSFSVISPQKGTALDLDPKQIASKFIWKNAKNGRIYDVYYTMYYKEGHHPSIDFEKKSIVWHMGSYSAIRTGDGSEQTENFQFNPGAFYAQIQRDIVRDESLWRTPYENVTLSIWCGSEDLYYYHNINNPSQGLAQERPEFTNLKTKIYSAELGGYQELENEAFGLFSSRLLKDISIRLSSKMTQIHLPEADRQFKSVAIE